MALAQLSTFVRSVLLLTVVTVLAGWVIVYGDKGLMGYVNLQKERDRLVVVKQELDEKNRELYERVKRLRDDRNYIEKTARHELGLVREGELVYRFKTPLSDPETAE